MQFRSDQKSNWRAKKDKSHASHYYEALRVQDRQESPKIQIAVASTETDGYMIQNGLLFRYKLDLDTSKMNPVAQLSTKKYNHVYYMVMKKDHCFIVFSPKKLEGAGINISHFSARGPNSFSNRSGLGESVAPYNVENHMYMDIFVNFSRTTSNLAISGLQSLRRFKRRGTLEIPELDELSKLSLSNIHESRAFIEESGIIEIDGNNEFNTIFQTLTQTPIENMGRAAGDYLLVYKMRHKQLWCYHLVGTGAIYLNKIHLRNLKGMVSDSKAQIPTKSNLGLPVKSTGFSIKNTSTPRSLNLSRSQLNCSLHNKKKKKRMGRLIDIPRLHINNVPQNETSIFDSERDTKRSIAVDGTSEHVVFMNNYNDKSFFILRSTGLYSFLDIRGPHPYQKLEPTKVGVLDLRADRISKIFSVLMVKNYLFISYEYYPEDRRTQADLDYKLTYGIKTYKITPKRELELWDDTLNYPDDLKSKFFSLNHH